MYVSDLYCPLDYISGSVAMTRLTSFFQYIMRKQGYCMLPYVDDMIGCALVGEADKQCDFLLRLLENLGFQITLAKFLRPTQVCYCLGIMTDTKAKTLCISKEKTTTRDHQ